MVGEASSRLGVFSNFLPISLHDLLRATNDRFRSQVLCFLLLKLPTVRSTLLGVLFCLDFDPFFSLLLFPCQVFSLYLFVCLFRFLFKECFKILNSKHQNTTSHPQCQQLRILGSNLTSTQKKVVTSMEKLGSLDHNMHQKSIHYYYLNYMI